MTQTEITIDEAHDRILFLSAVYAMTEKEITARWPDWHAKYVRARESGADSVDFLLWKCQFAKPAYAAIAKATGAAS
ncbi:MAG: hypothetical protein RLW68_01645 [Devosia marina]|uniref:hypothetical protein n=1 Tax=Devosia marina TaxID=2683198 RepID=UPI0032EC9D3F